MQKSSPQALCLQAASMQRRMLLPALAPAILIIMILLIIPPAYAHPYIDTTIPSMAQNAPVGTDEIVVFFSEAVDIDYSEIKVINDKGDRVDNRDIKYHEGETSLTVSAPPLEEGVYTVSTKVLSKVDGHLVPGVFIFGVGDVIVDQELLDGEDASNLIFLPEAGAEFLGILGQTIVVGAAVAALAVWRSHARKDPDLTVSMTHQDDSQDMIHDRHHKRLVQVMGAGLLLVLASDMLVIILQMARLEAGLAETIQTQFGMIWLARMIMTLALVGAWFAMQKAGQARQNIAYAAMLAVALAIMATSSLSGHGAATESAGAVILDYIHNIVAGVWIGGIIYIVSVLLPVLSGITGTRRERISLRMIPSFSAIFIISVGIVIVTGPTLLWMLEGDVGLITESVFGRLIMLKIAIASVMIGTGALIQYRIQKKAEADIALSSSKGISVHGRLTNALRIDAALGISLLVVVALLTNGTLPAGEIRTVEEQDIPTGFVATEFSENLTFDIAITPFSTGENLVVVSVQDEGGGALEDLDRVKVKTSSPDRGIPPIEIEMTEVRRDAVRGLAAEYRGDLTFAFSGRWLVEVEAQRLQNANEAVVLDVLAKPLLSNLGITLTEYAMPVNGTSPLHAAYDRSGGMWFTDASEPRLWRADTGTGSITSHEFDGTASSFVVYNAHDGSIWFTDSRGAKIGHIDIQNDSHITTIAVPDFKSRAPTPNPVAEKAIPFFIEAGPGGDIWITIINKGIIARYQPDTDVWTEIHLPGRNTLPFALKTGPDGMIWYTATGTGEVGYVDPATNTITVIIKGMENDGPAIAVGAPDDINDSDGLALRAPEALLFEHGRAGAGLWIAEHTGLAVTRYDTILGTLERHVVPDPDALPFGMTLDKYGNIWFAEHTIDKIGTLDPRSGAIIQTDIPTSTSFVQFLESDDDGNIWFAEQRADKIGMISITENPGTYQAPEDGAADAPYDLSSMRYADLVSPLMALGVLATSLFYIRAVGDRRRLGRLLADGNQPP